MKIKFDDYQISLLTQMFNVTPDTIRLYANKGILKPVKNEENNYRIFRRDDVFTMEYIMRLREMEIPLNDIKEIVCNDSLEDTDLRLVQKMQEINNQIEKLQNISKKICDYRELLSELQGKMGQIQFKEETVLLLTDIIGSIPNTVQYLKSLDPKLEPILTVYLPGNKFLQECEENYLDRDKRQESNLVVTCEDINRISQCNTFPTGRISVIGPSKFLVLLCQAETEEKFDGYDIINRFIKENGLTRNGRVCARYVATQNIYQRAMDYYEIWAPIK